MACLFKQARVKHKITSLKQLLVLHFIGIHQLRHFLLVFLLLALVLVRGRQEAGHIQLVLDRFNVGRDDRARQGLFITLSHHSHRTAETLQRTIAHHALLHSVIPHLLLPRLHLLLLSTHHTPHAHTPQLQRTRRRFRVVRQRARQPVVDDLPRHCAVAQVLYSSHLTPTRTLVRLTLLQLLQQLLAYPLSEFQKSDRNRTWRRGSSSRWTSCCTHRSRRSTACGS